MQSVNKIHINNSTKLSLNDRFSSLHSAPSTAVTAARRNATIVNKASIRNRNLLAQLDQKHKLRAAIKIKRVRVATRVELKQNTYLINNDNDN